MTYQISQKAYFSLILLVHLKVFITWFSSIKFGTGGYSTNAVCEGLCTALRLGMTKKCDERIFVLFTNSNPSILGDIRRSIQI